MNRLGLTYYIGLLFTLLLISTVAMAQVKDTLYGTWGGWQNGTSFHEGNPTPRVLSGYRNGREHAGFIQFNTSGIPSYAKPYNLTLHLKTMAEAGSNTVAVGISSIIQGFAPYGDTSQAALNDMSSGYYTGYPAFGIGMDTLSLNYGNAEPVFQYQMSGGKFQLGVVHHGPWRRYSSGQSFLTVDYDTCLVFSTIATAPLSCGSNGQISISVDSSSCSGPVCNYTYIIKDIDSGTTDTIPSIMNTHIITGSAGNLYEITVQIGSCLTNAKQVYIPKILTIELKDLANASCYGNWDGSIEVFAAGGTGPYTYTCLPDTQQNYTGKFDNLQAGLVTCIVEDNLGCTDTLHDFLIAQPPNGDLGLQEIISPVSGCGLGIEPVTIRVRNNADFNFVSGATVNYTLDGGQPKV